jgi:hypothetical protein
MFEQALSENASVSAKAAVAKRLLIIIIMTSP